MSHVGRDGYCRHPGGLSLASETLAVRNEINIGMLRRPVESTGKKTGMPNSIMRGTLAGAVGTVALDAATYLDMAIRGRPSSSVPAKVAGTLAEGVGVDLSSGGDGQQKEEKAQNRQSGLGALMGYVTGLSVGAAYGLVRPHLGNVSILLAGGALGLAAMAASDIPAVTTKATNLASWDASSWISDLVPHLAYGLATAISYEAFDED